MGIIFNLGAVLTRGTRLRRDPAYSFWVTTRMKACKEKVPFAFGESLSSLGGERPALPLLPAGWMAYFTNQTSGRF